MTLQIYDKNGRESFYQWDLNQKLTSSDLKVGDEIHFTKRNQSEALPMIAYDFNGAIVVDVPNILLQSTLPLIVYRYINNGTDAYTKEEYTFEIQQRPKPMDYCYTETEVYNIKRAVSDALTEAKESGDFDGEPGYTPERGVDYWTEDDKEEITSEVEKYASDLINEQLGDVSTLLNEVINVQENYIGGGIE